MEFKDYYKILGVDKKADAAAIKSAYRKLARKYHPDVNPGDPGAAERFKEINEAHEVLSDPEKRKKYDDIGSNWNSYARGPFAHNVYRSGGFRNGGRFEEKINFDGVGDDVFSDFFRAFFGGDVFRGQEAGFRGPRKGGNLEGAINITLEDAVKGAEREIAVRGHSIKVRIPPGVTDGFRLRLAQQGEEGAGGGPAGDLYLQLNILPHPIFKITGRDLEAEIPITVAQALLGGDKEISTPRGRVTLRLKTPWKKDTVYRLKGLGLPALKNESEGNLLVKTYITVPENPTGRERELYEELARIT